MKPTKFSLGLATAAIWLVTLAHGPLAAFADSIPEVEHGRAEARSGREITPREADLLNRWGDHSGQRGYHPDDDDDDDYYNGAREDPGDADEFADDGPGPYGEAAPEYYEGESGDDPYRPRRLGTGYSPY